MLGCLCRSLCRDKKRSNTPAGSIKWKDVALSERWGDWQIRSGRARRVPVVTEADTQFQHSGRANVHCNTRSMAPEVSVVRHAEVFVVVFGGVGELQ